MSLDNIQLPAFLIADLYKDCLIQLDTVVENKPSAASAGALKFLGANQQNIAILVKDAQALHINEQDLTFLANILQACKLSINEVAIINTQQQSPSYQDLQTQFNSKVLLLFGIKQDDIGLPINFPNYQIQSFNQQSYLVGPALSIIAAQKDEKMQLWTSLKKLFNV